MWYLTCNIDTRHLSVGTGDYIRKKFYMSDLKATLTHILEHEGQLVGANEATTQQYVVLPILRALGWNDTDLAAMEVLPEYQVGSGRADYALYVKPDESPVVLIECKRWNEPITKHEEQICSYAYIGNIPLALITDGRHWRFYLPHWRASSLRDRIFCETDIAVDLDSALSDLERYLLKSNIASGESELNAEIALEEKEKTDIPEPVPSDARVAPKNHIPDTVPKQQTDFFYSGAQLKAMREQAGLTQVEVALALGLAAGSSAGVGDWEADRLKVPAKHRANLLALYSQTGVVHNWTATRVRNSLSEEVRTYHEAHFSEERRNIFYEKVAETQNLIEAEGWRLKNPPELRKVLCPFFLSDSGVTRVSRIFGIVLQHFLPYAKPIGRNGEKIQTRSLTSNPPRFFVRIMEAEARQLERQYGCKFLCMDSGRTYIYYDMPDDVRDLLPVFEFAYNKHRGNGQ